jgi:hypothetical protein
MNEVVLQYGDLTYTLVDGKDVSNIVVGDQIMRCEAYFNMTADGEGMNFLAKLIDDARTSNIKRLDVRIVLGRLETHLYDCNAKDILYWKNSKPDVVQKKSVLFFSHPFAESSPYGLNVKLESTSCEQFICGVRV